jgi:hypothetical protein
MQYHYITIVNPWNAIAALNLEPWGEYYELQPMEKIKVLVPSMYVVELEIEFAELAILIHSATTVQLIREDGSAFADRVGERQNPPPTPGGEEFPRLRGGVHS